VDFYFALSVIASIVSIISFGMLVWVTITLFLSKKRLERKMTFHEKDEKKGPSKRPAAIVIGIGKNPLGSVEKFLADKGWVNIPIFSMAEGFLQIANRHRFPNPALRKATQPEGK